MTDYRSEHIKELISIMCNVGLDKCSFEFYMNSEINPLKSKENRNIEKVPALIGEIKKEHHLAFAIKDTKKMSSIEAKRIYDQCAHWAQNPKKHEYGTSRMIYDVFVGGEAGDWFGKEIPAMIAYNSRSGEFLFMLPHNVTKEVFSLRRRVSSHSKETISIYDFLKGLRQNLGKLRISAANSKLPI